MRAEDLDHHELLELDPEGGTIHFAGQRALLLDAVSVGLLMKYLMDSFGFTAARAVLTRFGFAHGWRMAETMQASFSWDSEDEWRLAGTRISSLQGMFMAEIGSEGPLSPGGMKLVSSYEAEQYLLHFGRADEPVCWTLCGLVSGHLSRSYGQEIFVLEDRCVGRGDAACHLVGRTREAWGAAHADALRSYDTHQMQESLPDSLHRITASLKIAERKLRAHQRALARAGQEAQEPLGIVARSAGMRRVIDLARRVARVDTTLLITGESGVGKERIARLVHDESSRVDGPFVAVNCGAITETLLESELFGHVRGAFTGATHDRIGLFEAANNGTILLDEIAEVSPGMQVKLLRVLQEREIRRVGENRTRRVNVRILAATNRDLSHDLTTGAFRQDLYYRLKVVELHIPPLRERRDDILPLARILLASMALRLKRTIDAFHPDVADQLIRYTWPGNVRELENAIEHAVVLGREGRVEMEDLPEEIRLLSPAHAPSQAYAPPPVVAETAPPTNGAVRPLDEIEKDYILAALALNGGNQTRTAQQLQIGVATLYRKLKAYGSQRDNGSPSSPSSSPG